MSLLRIATAHPRLRHRGLWGGFPPTSGLCVWGSTVLNRPSQAAGLWNLLAVAEASLAYHWPDPRPAGHAWEPQELQDAWCARQ